MFKESSEGLFEPSVLESLWAVFSSNLQESDDNHFGGVDEGLGSFGVGQPSKGIVWERRTYCSMSEEFTSVVANSLHQNY